jgi:hypothetical protein
MPSRRRNSAGITIWPFEETSSVDMACPAFVVELQAYLGLRRKAKSDSIIIDAGRFLIQLNVSDAELAKRRQAWTPRAPRYTRGVLAKYAKLVSSASRGAVTD